MVVVGVLSRIGRGSVDYQGLHGHIATNKNTNNGIFTHILLSTEDRFYTHSYSTALDNNFITG